MRHIERAVHDDVGDGVEPARREVLGAGDEIAGGVVDEAGQRTVAEDLLDHRIDRRGVADVDAVARNAPAMSLHQFGSGRVAHALAPAADRDLGPEAEKPLGHRLASPVPPPVTRIFFPAKRLLTNMSASSLVYRSRRGP